MMRSRPLRPRVMLNRDAGWELPDRLGMSWNEPARGSYGNAAGIHHPRDGPRATAAILPGPPSPAWPGEY